MIVGWEYYRDTYMGTDADPENFYRLNIHASRIVSAMTHWQVTEDNISSFPGIVQTMYRLAICCQIDFLALNGLESINSTGGGGFTVGKVTVRESAKSEKGGAMSGNISPETIQYLEQSGLMNPAVPVVGGCVC